MLTWLSSVCLFGTGCNSVSAQTLPSLKEVFKNNFLIGAAINQNQISERDTIGVAILSSQFNSISPENVLKWERVHPHFDRYDFDAADRYVAFGKKYGMAIIGHVLVWHNQTPPWVFEDSAGKPVDRETLLQRMHEHIATVVGRYKGQVHGWDVVNEAVNEDGTLRESPWLKIIGEDYIEKAFQYAHEADPSAELHYNDFSLENKPKRDGVLKLITKLKEHGVPVTAVGLQGHYKMDWPTLAQIDTTVDEFGKLGTRVMITELDVDVVPATQANRGADLSLNNQRQAHADVYAAGLPDSVQQALAKRYAGLFTVFLRHKEIERITFWGVTDANSWLNTRGRTNYPLLFDREGKAKPAFDAVIKH
ncbi:MAG TPA: endo-1,4-beta-xylanase [Bacteroidota bacterium]|nr:endo-1,4-beta-xylanase [Bacteroidota bacterium]